MASRNNGLDYKPRIDLSKVNYCERLSSSGMYEFRISISARSVIGGSLSNSEITEI